MGRGKRAQRAAGRHPEASRTRERGPRLTGTEVRRSRRALRAVEVAELRARLRDLDVRVPAPAAEQRRLEPELAEPIAFREHALSRPAACRSSVIRRGPVRVVAE